MCIQYIFTHVYICITKLNENETGIKLGKININTHILYIYVYGWVCIIIFGNMNKIKHVTSLNKGLSHRIEWTSKYGNTQWTGREKIYVVLKMIQNQVERLILPLPSNLVMWKLNVTGGMEKKKNICLKRRNSFSPGSAMNKLFLNLKTRQKIQRVGLEFTLCTDVFRRINYLLIYCQ